MKKGILQFIAFMIIFSYAFFGCSPKEKYERKLKHELATGLRNDSLFLGLYLGMPEKDFYMHCWKLNQKGLIKQGSNNTTVEYQLKGELKYPGLMNFYPSFVNGKIAEMPVRFIYAGWAPWNQKLSSDSLQSDVLQWVEKKHGGRFMKVDHPKRGSAFININGNRRITIFKENDMNVLALFTDMSVMKEINDSLGIKKMPTDTTNIIK